MEQPLHYWVPSIAPSGMAFVTSERYGKAWQGNLLVGALAGRHVARLELAGGKVVREAGPMKHGTTILAFVEDPDGYKIELIQRKHRVD